MGNITLSIRAAVRRRSSKKVKSVPAVVLAKGDGDGDTAGAASLCCIDNPGAIKDFYFLEESKIGEGSYGRVVKCTNKATGIQRACKLIKKTRSAAKELEMARKEIVICRQLDHPHIAKLFEHFEDSNYIYMVMVLCPGGEVFDRMAEVGHFTEPQTAYMMQQVLRAMFYMHTLQVAHRDMKLENWCLLYTGPIESNTIKIIDFGSSTTFQTGELMYTKCGSPYFISPQMLAGSYTEACDMWTVGVVMYVLLCGYPPFFGGSDAEILSKVRVGMWFFNQADWKHVSDLGKEVVRGLIKMSPNDRMDAKEALHHPWFTVKVPRVRAPFKLRYLDNMRMYVQSNLVKKLVLKILAATLDEEYTKMLIDCFMWLDGSGEGTISEGEITDGMLQSGISQNQIPKDLSALIAGVDDDNSGELEITEFVASTLDPRIYTNDEFCWAAFRIFDQNCMGLISVQEVYNIVNNGSGREKVDWETCKAEIDEMDENGDGSIDFGEFMHMMHGTTAKKKPPEQVEKEIYEKHLARARRIGNIARENGVEEFQLALAAGFLTDAFSPYRTLESYSEQAPQVAIALEKLLKLELEIDAEEKRAEEAAAAAREQAEREKARANNLDPDAGLAKHAPGMKVKFAEPSVKFSEPAPAMKTADSINSVMEAESAPLLPASNEKEGKEAKDHSKRRRKRASTDVSSRREKKSNKEPGVSSGPSEPRPPEEIVAPTSGA